jgi:hypothetical protein
MIMKKTMTATVMDVVWASRPHGGGLRAGETPTLRGRVALAYNLKDTFMKTKYITLILAALMAAVSFSQEPPEAIVAPQVPPSPSVPVESEEGSIIIKATGINSKPAPLFFSARAETAISVSADTWRSESTLHFDIVQGNAVVLAIGVYGDGDIVSVTGEGIRDWAVRQTAEGRLLEIRPDGDGRKSIVATVVACAREAKFSLPVETAPVTFGSGAAVGFSSHITLTAAAAVDVRVVAADGLIPLETGKAKNVWRFQAWGANALKLALTRDGAALAAVEIRNAQLEGQVDRDQKTAAFVLTGDAVVSAEDGGAIAVLSGHAAITEFPESADYRLRLNGNVYELVFERAGTFPVRVAFQAGVLENGAAQSMSFQIPAGAVVPVKLSGYDAEVKFDAKAAVYPVQKEGAWVGFLPANGQSTIAWGKATEAEAGKLFFASDAVMEVRLGAGLLRQTSYLDMKILQGKLDGLRVELDGPGEIVAVSGANVLSWAVENGEAGKRMLVIKSVQPAEATDGIVVSSQTPIGDFPLTVEPLRLTPEGAVRHSGFVRIGNTGAVRLEVTGVNGMTQLAPEQFPAKDASLPPTALTFIYRFPSAIHNYAVRASQILPEIGVKQVLIYEMTESDRVITARVEMDIREASIREWELLIPESFAVVGINGAEVNDYVPATDAVDGMRNLKVLFRQEVIGRQLIELRLEQNTPAAAGVWALPMLSYPDAKTVRGHLGVGTVAGYRVTPGEMTNVSEVPLAYFPTGSANLQQAFRIREADWSAAVNIEALQQSVQADVYHLYSLKEGVTYGSVLVNYFVVGAPVSEWRLGVPSTIGNIAIDGEDVQGWRREGEEVIVTLHQPALGAATLLLTFEQPMSARGGTLNPGEVKPLNVQGERGFVQVVSPSQVRHAITKLSPGLLKIEPLELPAEFRLLSNSPSLAVLQYAARPFELEMNIEWYEPGETIDQVVDYSTLSSRISRDGQIVTDAGFFVKTRGRKALELTLPTGASLWEARVAGEVVNARVAGALTLIPLPASLDPNAPVEVRVRMGQTSENAKKPVLSAPVLAAPTMFASWKITGDRGRLLVPVSAQGAETGAHALTETGFEWLRNFRHPGMLVLCIAIVAGLALGCVRKMGTRVLAVIALLIAVGFSVMLAVESSEQRRVNQGTLNYAAPIVAPGETVTVTLKNVANWEAMLNWGGIAIAVVGVGLMGIGIFGTHKGLLPAVGWALVACGLLTQHLGAPLFFAWLALFIVIGVLIPMIAGLMRRISAWQAERRLKKEEELAVDTDDDGSGGTPVTMAVLLLTMLGSLFMAQPARADSLPSSSVQTVRIEQGRLFAEMELQLNGKAGELMQLLTGPAVLTDFVGEGLRVTKRPNGEQVDYWMVLERDGDFTAKVSYELALGGTPASVVLPAVTAAARTVEVRIDQAGWEISSPVAVKSEAIADLAKGWSGARLLLSPQGAAEIKMQPQSRDVSMEEAQFFAEVLNVFVPAPGLVDARHRVTVKPARGQVNQLMFEVPAGFTVSNVAAESLSGWRFDPEARSLKVEFSPPVSKEFAVLIDTQQGSDALPAQVELSPLTVMGAVNQVGMLALAFGADAQSEKVEAKGLSEVALVDFDAGMLEGSGAVLNRVWRYGKDGGSLSASIVGVEAEVRVQTQQTLSIGDERLVLAIDVMASITRAGLFQLSFPLPAGLEIESTSGESVSHWTETEGVVTLHLKGRTSGQQTFAITFTGTAPGALAEWDVPQFSINEATRQAGQLLVSPEQGIRAQPKERSHVSQVDARTIAGNQPGTLAFRLLQADWALKLQLEALAPWVTAQALQEVLLREGVTRTRLAVSYRVENAAVKSLRVTLPGLSDEEEKTVRASGEAVSDIVRVEAEDDVWELRFQRRILGNVAVSIEFQKTSERSDGLESVVVATLADVKQLAMWVAVRVAGRLDISVASAGQGWQRTDWPSVPRNLQDVRDTSVPALAFRAVQPEQALSVKVQRHEVAEALSLRVSSGKFTTVFSPNGDSATEAEMRVVVTEKSTMRVNLPEGAVLFNAFVNSESMAIVREDGAYLFHVLPPEEGTAATVSLAWSAKDAGFKLIGPRLNVPLQNITWWVALPDGLRLSGSKGSLDLESEKDLSGFTLQNYSDEYRNRREAEANSATEALQKANTWINSGDQQKARKALSRASKSQALDLAANEDARVQLRELQTQQAVVGLNTRRQKLYLDNKDDDPGFARNEQLEQAATNNPLLKGKLNYNGQAMDSLLLGNTAEENGALNQMAGRIVSQQLAAEPALQAIDVTLPPSGKLLTFKRSVQVNGNAPLELQLNVSRRSETSGWFVLLVGVLLVGVVILGRKGVTTNA